MAQTPVKNPTAPPHFQVPISGVGPHMQQMLRIPNHFFLDDALATISAAAADAVITCDLPVGAYVYRQLQLSITHTAEIVGKTYAVQGGKHLVTTAAIADYISRVQIEINGKVEIDYFVDELTDLNKLLNYDVTGGFLTYSFGAPGLFKLDGHEDAYLMGTGNVQSVRLLVYTKAAWVAGMKLGLMCEYAATRRPIGFLTTTRRTRHAASAAGEWSTFDIPRGVDIGAIWIRSTNATAMSRVELEVDQRSVFSGYTWQLRQMLQIWGKDINALPQNDLVLDFFRENDGGKGLGALISQAQIRRDADIKLTLNFDAPGATFHVLTQHCGMYQVQR